MRRIVSIFTALFAVINTVNRRTHLLDNALHIPL